MSKILAKTGLTRSATSDRPQVNANDLLYTPVDNTDWDADADPGNGDDALDQLAGRVDSLEASTSAPDASIVTYTPTTLSNWNSSSDPGNVDDALDQLASRLASATDDRKVLTNNADATPGFLTDKLTAGANVTLTITGSTNKQLQISVPSLADATDISYAPSSVLDWNSNSDPGNVDDALDQLADRVDTLEALTTPNASIIAYTAATAGDWNGNSQPGEVNDALDQLADRLDNLETSFGPTPDASGITYSPSTVANWPGSTDPGNVDDALDQLANMIDGLVASDISYTATTLANWPSGNPGDVDLGLDVLASRVRTLETSSGDTPDASAITFTPASNSNWNSSSDPGNVDDALDQLASRLTSLNSSYSTFVSTVNASGIAYTPDNVNHWDGAVDPGNADDALDQLASRMQTVEDTPFAAPDEQVKVSVTDTTKGYLLDKIVEGTGIDLTRNNSGADEELVINTTGIVKANVSDTAPGTLADKITAGSGATVTLVDTGSGDYVVQIGAGGAADSETTTYTPNGSWASIGTTPDNVEEALDTLATALTSNIGNSTKARVSVNDAAPNYLSAKITAGTGISVTVSGNPGDNQLLVVANTATTPPDASVVTYTPGNINNWNSNSDPGDVDNALDQLALRTYLIEQSGTGSAALTVYVPNDLSDWNSSIDPGNVDDALDQLADRIKTVESSYSATAVTYTPTTLTDWNSSSDPGNADDAFDQLAARIKTIETSGPGGDANAITFTPFDLNNWTSASDPGNVDGALDQLVYRLGLVEAWDAGNIDYTPTTLTDWNSDLDPGTSEAAFDQLASRLKVVESWDATDIEYTPAVNTDWNSDLDPGTSSDAINQLASRLKIEEARVYDIYAITYTPPYTIDWSGDVDPGSAGDAISQLAYRIKTIETAGAGDVSDLTFTPADTAYWSGLDPGNADDALEQLAFRLTEAEDGISTTSNAIPSRDGWLPCLEEWAYAGTDAPSFTITTASNVTDVYSVGMRFGFFQTTGGQKYFIVTKVEFSSPDTILTLYGGTDYVLENETISTPNYSTNKAPYGFPLDPNKWTVKVTDTTAQSEASPTQNDWYNLGAVEISIPIGTWLTSYQVCAQLDASTVGTYQLQVTLSTANNSASDSDFTTNLSHANDQTWALQLYRDKYLAVASKTSYYLNTRTLSASVDTINNCNDISKLVLRAVCAYL